MFGVLFVRFIALPDRVVWACVAFCEWSALLSRLALRLAVSMEP